MRNLKILFTATLFAIVFTACDEQTELTPPPPESEFVQVEIPDSFAHDISNGRTHEVVETEIMDIKVTTNTGQEVFGQIRFTMPSTSEETLINLEITNNLIEETELTPDFWINYNSSENLSSRVLSSSCIADCHAQNPRENDDRDNSKNKNHIDRFWCKVECWAKIIIPAAAAVALAVITSS